MLEIAIRSPHPREFQDSRRGENRFIACWKLVGDRSSVTIDFIERTAASTDFHSYCGS
jgi:hypothetical protein